MEAYRIRRSEARLLGEEPWIDPTAVVTNSRVGAWTAVHARTNVVESVLGDYSYIMNDSDVIYADIGKFCSIASHSRINPGNHPLWRAALHHFTYRSASYGLADEDDHGIFEWRRAHKVTIGHDVWIGHGAIVLPGVRIGNGAVVGAGAVVSRDVPPFTMVAGVPARVIRRRVSEAVEALLEKIAWWDWSRECLQAALEDFRQLDAAAFAEKHKSRRS